MAKLWVTEYHKAGKSAEGGAIPTGLEPRIATQIADFTAGVGSVTLDKNTHFVRLYSDTFGYFTVGPGAVAQTGVDSPISANVPEHFGCAPGMDISIIQ